MPMEKVENYLQYLLLQPFYGPWLLRRCLYGTHVLVCGQLHKVSRTALPGIVFQFFVFSVCGLTASVIMIAYWIGLPYWWNKSPMTTVAILLVGHWLLVNICFHYYMAASTLPGYPP
ncbi:unnamed protein product, partial [Timema podura]|nr:unnamed protein product [Timema podura]